MNAAWVIAVALTLQQPPPTAPATAPVTPVSVDDHPLTAFPRYLARDLASLPRLQTAAIVGAGLAGVALTHSSDATVANWVETQGPSLSYTPIGGLIGNEWLQGGAAIATYVIGRVQHSPEVVHIGSDLIRAQTLNGVLTLATKVAVDRERPNAGALSFPSGHSSSTFASATVLADHYGWKVGVPAYAVAGFIGWTRVRDRQHWLSDVVFGTAIGVAAGKAVTLGHTHGRAAWSVVPAATNGGGAVYVVKTR